MKHLFTLMTGFLLGILSAGLLLAYNADLDTPVNVPDVSDKFMESITFSTNCSPGQWKLMSAGEKLDAVAVRAQINQWRINGEGNWEIVTSEYSETTATVFFQGSMSGQAANFSTRIKELMIAAGIISGDDVWS